METTRIIKGLRALGVEDKCICDFILYYASGDFNHYKELESYGKSKMQDKVTEEGQDNEVV